MVLTQADSLDIQEVLELQLIYLAQSLSMLIIITTFNVYLEEDIVHIFTLMIKMKLVPNNKISQYQQLHNIIVIIIIIKDYIIVMDIMLVIGQIMMVPMT